MRTTRELYMQDASSWADMNYRNAIKMRIFYAQEAMKQYRLERNEEGYTASEKAVAFNRQLLAEITKESK